MGRLFHSLGAALENDLTPKFFVLFCFSLVDTGDAKTRMGGGPQHDALEGREVLVPEGSGGLCRSCSCTQETGLCSHYAFHHVASHTPSAIWNTYL